MREASPLAVAGACCAAPDPARPADPGATLAGSPGTAQPLHDQPFARLLGMRLTACGAGQAEFQLPLRNDLTQHDSAVHGGVISSLADMALAWAGGSTLGGRVVTAGLTLNFVRPARGTLLIARAGAVTTGQRQAVCRCDVLVRQGAEEQLCAIAQGTVVRQGGKDA